MAAFKNPFSKRHCSINQIKQRSAAWLTNNVCDVFLEERDIWIGDMKEWYKREKTKEDLFITFICLFIYKQTNN